MAVATYTKTGTKATTPAKLDKAVFGVEAKNHELLKLAYNSYLANGRQNNAVTKTRTEVRGGGRKPWKQKGTGRARAGSIRSPIWRGGGITFGPTGEENYSRQLNPKAKRQALRQALSMASAAGNIAVMEDITTKNGKTAELAALLTKIGASRNILIVVDQKSDELIRAAGNLPNVQLVSARYLTVYNIMNADYLLFSQPALAAVTDWLGKPAKTRSVKEAK